MIQNTKFKQKIRGGQLWLRWCETDWPGEWRCGAAPIDRWVAYARIILALSDA